MVGFKSVLSSLLVLTATTTHAFYLPGVAPTSYDEGDKVDLFVNHITPSLRKQDSNSKTYLYSYDYYFDRFHFCEPADGKQKQSESLGSILFGDRIFNSPFNFKLLENSTCNLLCTSTYPKEDTNFVNENIRAGFQFNMMIDGLPVARPLTDSKTGENFYSSGFNIGYDDDEENNPHLYNHYDFYIEYHLRSDGHYRIVGATVNPRSIAYNDLDNLQCDLETVEPVQLIKGESKDVTFTYSVYWIPSDTVWATRWDQYLHVYDPKIQWFALTNFSLIVVLLAIIMSHVLFKNLRNDIKKYNEVNLDDDVIDDMGWKLIYGDVFRPPKNPMLLSVLIGSGIQILLMSITTCGLAAFGLLSPSNRGSLGTVMFVLYSIFGSIGSFYSSYIYKFFKGQDWKINMILSPILVPGSLFLIFIFINFFLIFAHSSGAVPAGTMLAILLIWLAVSIPLSCIGSVLGLKKLPIELPVKVNQIARQIPPQPKYMKTLYLALIAGIFPFGAIAIEMYFIYNSLWFNRIYYMFGFLFFCFILMLITCMLVTLLLIYFSLCNENYNWQWKSFFISGGISIYVFIHAIILSKLNLGGLTSIILYVGYSFVIAALVGLMCGTLGYLCTMYLTLHIYGQIKVD
jgi:transmembrane 9 superfamily protein 2/4